MDAISNKVRALGVARGGAAATITPTHQTVVMARSVYRGSDTYVFLSQTWTTRHIPRDLKEHSFGFNAQGQFHFLLYNEGNL